MVSTLKLPVGIEMIVKRNLRYCPHATIPRGVLDEYAKNPETYKPKFHCRRQSGMNFG